MRYLLFSLIILVGVELSAQTKIPAATHAVMNVLSKDLKKNNRSISKKNQLFYQVYERHHVFYIDALAKVNNSFNPVLANQSGIMVHSVFANIASLSIPVLQFKPDFNFPGIEFLEHSEKIEPFLDLAVPDTRADSVHMGFNLPQAYTGKNVLIGIADWGFDYSHPDFYDTSMTKYRVLAAWDQVKTSGPAPAGFSYGTEYPDSTSLLIAEADTFSRSSTYHGSHVAGIAGGGGAGTAYRGIGFDGQFLFAQMGSTTTGAIDAFNWMYQKSLSEGKRLVINNSWGGYRVSPMDGTSLVSQAMDAYSDSGVVFVNSGGNNGAVNFHLKKTFSNDSVKTRISGFNYSSDTNWWGQGVSIWGEVGKPFSIQVRTLSNVNVLLGQTQLFFTNDGSMSLDSFYMAGTDTVRYKVIIDSAYYLNNRPYFQIDVQDFNTSHKQILFAQADTGTIHCWNVRVNYTGGSNTGYAFITNGSGYVIGDKNFGTGHPGITEKVITVAAHQSNLGIASFSSYGPRIDSLMKPDVSAPGFNIGSALSSFSTVSFTPVASVVFNSKTYEFMKISGTSMSAPMVTGIVSLLLESDPTLTSDEIKTIIKSTARTDSYTGIIPTGGSTRWGMGKVNAYAAVKATLPVEVEEISENSGIKIYPNPAGDYLFIDDVENNRFAITIYSMNGKVVMEADPVSSVISIHQLPKGVYLMRLVTDSKTVVFRLIKS